MNKQTLIGGFAAALLVTAAACSSPGPATTTKTTTTTTNSNSASRTAPPAAPAASNTAPAAADSTASAEGKQDFTVVNKTGVEINALHVAPHSSDDWEEDILGQDTLASGESLAIKFNRNEKTALWDLRIEDTGGNAIEWENLNLLEISKVTLHYKDGKASAETE